MNYITTAPRGVSEGRGKVRLRIERTTLPPRIHLRRRATTVTLTFLVALSLVFYGSGTNAGGDKWLQPDRSRLESRMDKLPFFPSRATTGGRSLTPNMFDRSELCGSCHTEIYAQWKGSVMAHAWADPIYQALLQRASRATDGAVDNFCIGCHSPVGLATHQATAASLEEEVELPGVGCESCHTISAITGHDNGAYVLTPDTTGRHLKYGPRRDAVSPYHATTYSELHARSEFCSVCHNVTHPFTSAAIERTYDEWLDSPYNEKGTQCQDCHMTPGPGATDNPGKSAIMGKERDQIYSHYFVGANSTLHRHFGREDMAERDRAMLRSAATIEFVDAPQQISPGQSLTVKIKVSNVGAGHKLPTGFPEGREVWVDFRAVDAEGVEVYRSGAVRDGHTEEGTKNFKVFLGNADGEVVDLNVWEVDRVLSDTRILPMGYAIVDYTFSISPQAKGPITLQADLNYWPFPQKIVDELLGKVKLEVEIVRMTSMEQQVALNR